MSYPPKAHPSKSHPHFLLITLQLTFQRTYGDHCFGYLGWSVRTRTVSTSTALQGEYYNR